MYRKLDDSGLGLHYNFRKRQIQWCRRSLIIRYLKQVFLETLLFRYWKAICNNRYLQWTLKTSSGVLPALSSMLCLHLLESLSIFQIFVTPLNAFRDLIVSSVRHLAFSGHVYSSPSCLLFVGHVVFRCQPWWFLNTPTIHALTYQT